MKSVLLIPVLLLTLTFPPNVVNGGQIALRPRPKESLLSRSIPSNSSIFDPTDEESFYMVGDDPKQVVKTLHQASKRKYVNFEKFEDYLRPQERLCTPSPDNKTMLLSFPLNHGLYLAARESWAGEKSLVFMGHDPSCFAPEEERSSFKSLSIAFDDGLQTIRVTGKPLRFGDRHFPAPTEMTIGRAPRDLTLTRRMDSAQQDRAGVWSCFKHPKECIIKHLPLDIGAPGNHIDFNSDEYQPRKKYWPPDDLKENTGVPELFELYCLECRTAGGVDQEFRIQFNELSGSDNEDEDEGDHDHDHRHSRRDDDDDNDDGDVKTMFKDHVKRAFVKYTVTEEIKIRKQFAILSNVAADLFCSVTLVGTSPPGTTSCEPAITAGGLQWEKGSARENKKARAKAMGPKEVDDKKAGSGKTNSWGYSIWPMDVGIVVWMDFGIGTQINMTLPGFEATIPVGSEFEIDVMGGDDTGPIHATNFDPIIEVLKADLSVQSTELHYNVAVGPKAGLNIGLPKGSLGIGFGVRLDLVRFDLKFSEYKNVTSHCVEPKPEEDEAIENAFGFTMDLKTGIYAFLNIAGFYVDSNWIGDKVGSDFSGLYWGIKNLVAKCGDCGEEPCLSKVINKALDSVTDKFDWIDQKFKVSELEETVHVAKDSILSLDLQMAGEDMPTGDPETACYAKPVPAVSRRSIFGGDDDEDDDDNKDEDEDDRNICQPK